MLHVLATAAPSASRVAACRRTTCRTSGTRSLAIMSDNSCLASSSDGAETNGTSSGSSGRVSSRLSKGDRARFYPADPDHVRSRRYRYRGCPTLRQGRPHLVRPGATERDQAGVGRALDDERGRSPPMRSTRIGSAGRSTPGSRFATLTFARRCAGTGTVSGVLEVPSSNTSVIRADALSMVGLTIRT